MAGFLKLELKIMGNILIKLTTKVCDKETDNFGGLRRHRRL